MKQDITRKEIKQRFGGKIVQIGYCKAATLLKNRYPAWVWYSNVHGWYCDIYLIDGVAVTTGYNPFGAKIKYDKLAQLEKQARSAISNSDKDKLKEIDAEFIKLINETVKGV